jgi:hypothetical protein
MVQISFILKHHNEVSFGKYKSEYLSDEHIFIDIILKEIVANTINCYKFKNENTITRNSYDDINIGILSVFNEKTSPEEIKIFDIYIYENHCSPNKSIYYYKNLIFNKADLDFVNDIVSQINIDENNDYSEVVSENDEIIDNKDKNSKNSTDN